MWFLILIVILLVVSIIFGVTKEEEKPIVKSTVVSPVPKSSMNHSEVGALTDYNFYDIAPVGVPVPAQTLKATNTDFTTYQKPLAGDSFFKPYSFNHSSIPYFSSVSAYAPHPEIDTQWEKMGMLTTVAGTDNVLNLYRRPIAPLRDLFEYAVQDKDGFITPLKGVTYLEDGDTVKSIIGKESLGEWKVHDFVINKYVLF